MPPPDARLPSRFLRSALNMSPSTRLVGVAREKRAFVNARVISRALRCLSLCLPPPFLPSSQIGGGHAFPGEAYRTSRGTHVNCGPQDSRGKSSVGRRHALGCLSGDACRQDNGIKTTAGGAVSLSAPPTPLSLSLYNRKCPSTLPPNGRVFSWSLRELPCSAGPGRPGGCFPRLWSPSLSPPPPSLFPGHLFWVA